MLWPDFRSNQKLSAKAQASYASTLGGWGGGSRGYRLGVGRSATVIVANGVQPESKTLIHLPRGNGSVARPNHSINDLQLSLLYFTTILASGTKRLPQSQSHYVLSKIVHPPCWSQAFLQQPLRPSKPLRRTANRKIPPAGVKQSRQIAHDSSPLHRCERPQLVLRRITAWRRSGDRMKCTGADCADMTS